ncbi:Aldolase-type TIM barrel [Phytophthora cactorum]|nr:Aldolase-type TIM barrel [Phytophthora cactorum]
MATIAVLPKQHQVAPENPPTTHEAQELFLQPRVPTSSVAKLNSILASKAREEVVHDALQSLFHSEYILLADSGVLSSYGIDDSARAARGRDIYFGYAAIELVSFTALLILLWRKFGFSPLYQLAFVLETQGPALQGYLFVWTITILHLALAHYVWIPAFSVQKLLDRRAMPLRLPIPYYPICQVPHKQRQAGPMSSVTADYKLYTPLELSKDLVLKNRVVYGPTTRARSDPETHVPLERNIVYYEQRAGAGLLVTEGCGISEQGFGWHGAPALYTDEQEAAWKELVDRVHAMGTKIFLQLWHMGRQSHPSFHPTNEVVSASATQYVGGTTRNASGERTGFEKARALETEEIPDVVEMYRQCAIRAKRAGFDGVEVHGANGYLVDQFLQSTTNQRTDKYGGSFENRYRFLHEIVEALKTVFPTGRIGVRLSPNGVFGGMGSKDNNEMFTYAFERLSEHGLAYLAMLDGFGFGYSTESRTLTVFDAKKAFKGNVMANNSYTRDTAEGVIRSGAADFVGFARLFMSNPDLAERFQNDWPVNPVPDYKYFWDAAMGDKGYNTFEHYKPTVEEQEQQP